MLAAPIDEIKAVAATTVAPRLDLWMYPRESSIHFQVHDSASVRGSGIGRFIHRLPGNEYFYRLEAAAEGSMTAARSMGWLAAGQDSVSGFATRGYGLSDILITSELRLTNPAPRRWTEFAAAPFVGILDRDASLQLMWENYELGARSGNADYSIEVTLERDRRTLESIAAEIVGALAKVVGVDRDPDRVTYRFARMAPHSAVIADYLTLKLATTPPGSYRLQVTVTDKVTGRRATSTSQFSIRK